MASLCIANYNPQVIKKPKLIFKIVQLATCHQHIKENIVMPVLMVL